MYLRSVPVLLIVALALNRKLEPWMVYNVVSRADELKEVFAAWQSLRGNSDLKKMPNALKNGIAQAFTKFDGYHFKKYNKSGKEDITFKDVLKLSHPKPKSDEQSLVFSKIKEDNLDPVETWETVISAAGSDPLAKRAAWESLLDNPRSLPYMVALRNVRNILQAKVSEAHIQKLLDLLSNKFLVLKSKQFPFRWVSAWNEIVREHDPNVQLNANRLLATFEEAIGYAVDNIPGIDSLTSSSMLIACDVSGSMQTPLSDRSKINLVEVGILLGRLLAKKGGRLITGVFGNEWAPVNFGNAAIANIQLPSVGLSTYGYKVLDWLLEHKMSIDKVVFFSDNQIYDDLGLGRYGVGHGEKNRSHFEQSWNKYKVQNPKAKIYMVNLADYGTYPINLLSQDVYTISGWNTNVFKVLDGLGRWGELKKEIMSYPTL